VIRTHDVIVQHLRVRSGETGALKGSGWEVDAISTHDGAYNVIIDHCSATWGTDENLSASGSRFSGATPDEWRAATSHDITFSYNIVAEGLSNSTHAEGEHSKGGLIHDNVTNMAVVGNLYFSNMDRHPLFKGGARGVVVNNYVANPGQWAMRYTLNENEWGDNPYQTGQMSVVGNVLRPGPSTPADVPLLRSSGVGPVEVYLSDNTAKTSTGADAPMLGGTLALFVEVASPPTWPDGLTPMASAELAEHIRANVGARPWERDAIDARIVEQALAGQGAIIDSEQEVGGYPVVEPTSAPFNPDEWDLATMTRR
jgi:pectate lyase